MAEEHQNTPAGAEGQAAATPQFQIQRIYVKDVSFESPNAPAIFTKEWKPEVKLDIDTSTAQIKENVFEVTLSITVTAKLGEETGFLCEVQQAGLFTIADMPEPNRAHMLGSFCPSTLFPYARETISNLVNRGTFPALNLAPVNFDAIFAAYMQKRAQQAQAAEQEQAPQLDA